MHMTTSPRERGRRAHRSVEEEFVLYLQGIPPHCRWQELKDFVRQTALHIRQAVVYDDQHGYPTGLGQIIVKNEDEAWRTYRKLSATGWDGQPLTVTLARASSPTRPIAGPTKSSPPSSHTLPYGGKAARHSVTGAPAPESPAITEPIRSHSIAQGTIYPQYIPPCTPAGHNSGHIQVFSPLIDSPGGYRHHHQAPAGWNMHPDGMGTLAFPSPAVTMFHPPSIEQQHIEYPYYFPHTHPMQFPMGGQAMYAETRYNEYQQQQAPSAFFSQFTPAANQYYQHHHQQRQGYQVYGYESPNNSLHSASTSEIHPNTAPLNSHRNNEQGVFPHQALPQGIRHIIIDNICPGVDIQTLQDHFHDAGHMLHCKIIRYSNHENGNETRYSELSYPGQCYAAATFSTAEEAERAVVMFNGSDLGGSKVVVRLDTEWISSTIGTEEGNNEAGGAESDWPRSQSYSLSFTPSSNALLASSVSSSTATSLGAFSVYSESANSQLSSIPTTNKSYYRHQQHRDRRDSGKEIFKPNTHPFLPSRSAQSDCVDDTSSRSVSPTSEGREGGSTGEEKPRTTTIMQPLVVNGSSPLRREKM